MRASTPHPCSLTSPATPTPLERNSASVAARSSHMEVELVLGLAPLGRVARELGGRQREDRPAAAGVDRLERENVAEERPRPLGLRGEDDDMHTGDHWSPPGWTPRQMDSAASADAARHLSTRYRGADQTAPVGTRRRRRGSDALLAASRVAAGPAMSVAADWADSSLLAALGRAAGHR